jgi:hypothetical protein
MRTNIQLNFKSDSYELVAVNRQISFRLEQIRDLKMQKKYNYHSIFIYFLFVLVSYIVLSQFYTIHILFFLMMFLLTLLWFKEFIYSPIYAIELLINSEQFSFEIKDNNVFQDFLILQHFYSGSD